MDDNMQKPPLLCPKWVKNKRGLEEFFSQLSEYCGEKVSLVFKNNIFEEIIYFKHLIEKYDVVFEKIVFKNVVFKQYVRFNDIQCKELEFLNVSFEKGGGLKNREGQYTLDIGRLIFRPFQVENDFVIDLGNYANKDGFLETEKIGRIREIEFENHKEGSGQIYLIGINQYTEWAHFRNKILDQVSFQNCNLTNCYFLNAKIDKTEFRNCVFPEIRNHFRVNGLDTKTNIFMLVFFVLSVPLVLNNLNNNFFDFDNPIFFFIFIFFVPFYVLLGLFALNGVSHPIEYWISGVFKGNKETSLNKIENFHHHFGVKDEEIINDALKNFKDSKNLAAREQLQQSYFNLIELYRQLKENFDKSDFQTAGNFFYAQRYIEMISTTYKKSWTESWVLNIHYMVNGFGERFIRPLVLLLLTIVVFSMMPFKANLDYIATQNTPRFLLIEYSINGEYAILPSPSEGNQSYYPVVTFTQEDNSTQYILNGEKIDKEINVYISTLKNDWHTQFYYSVSHIILPFASENRQWFKEISQWAIFFGYIESALLWLFSGAFVLALYHRIKRGET